MAAEAVSPGTTWRNRGTGAPPVLVMKVTAGGNVCARRSDGKTWTIPLGTFLGQYDPVRTGDPHMCARCGSSSLRLIDKYCKDCQSLIARVRNRRKATTEEEEVLTTTDAKLIQQRRQEEQAKAASTASVPSAPARELRWRITARIVMELIVEGATIIDALGAVEGEHPGVEVTNVNLADE